MTARARFSNLCENVLDGNIAFSNIDNHTFIGDYVREIEHIPSQQYTIGKIRSAPDMINVRVYNYEPGTGGATKQFYKFAKAITIAQIFTDLDYPAKLF